jgi:glycosyltransferase involved in cell wall biosynthesis
MRILHVNKFAFRNAGAESYMLDLMELQQKAGHETAVFAMTHPRNEPSAYSRHFPPQVEYDPLPDGITNKVRASALMFWNRKAASGLATVIEQFRPDVAHLHNVYHQLSPSVLRPLRQSRTPVVMTLHDYKLVCPTYSMLDHGRPCEACLPHSFHQAALHRCKNDSVVASGLLGLELGVHRLLGAYGSVQRFICPSDFLAGKMRKGALYPDRLRHLPNFADIPDEAAPDNPTGPFVFVGRLAFQKAVDVLINAVALVPNAQLEIVGDGPERGALERQAADVATTQVRFLGHLDRDSVARTMASARAVVLSSRWYENQPMVLLEAMALGLPVIGTDLGGTPELIEAGNTGLLVQADDPEGLAAAMRRLLNDPAAARAMGDAGRERAIAVHAPSVHLAQLDDIYASASDALHSDGQGQRQPRRSNRRRETLGPE